VLLLLLLAFIVVIVIAIVVLEVGDPKNCATAMQGKVNYSC